MATFKCRYCQHEWQAKEEFPMCPRGCTCDRTESPKPGVFSTAQRLTRDVPRPVTQSASEVKPEPTEQAFENQPKEFRGPQPETPKSIGKGTCPTCKKDFKRLDMHVCAKANQTVDNPPAA